MAKLTKIAYMFSFRVKIDFKNRLILKKNSLKTAHWNKIFLDAILKWTQSYKFGIVIVRWLASE